MSKIYKLVIFFIIVQNKKKNNNKVILRTLAVNARGQKIVGNSLSGIPPLYTHTMKRLRRWIAATQLLGLI